ncbi:MAG: PocR ligand-binding domain-containing protein [Spirochaetales bacterium]|nr:PocR ligand-binding domain-containing protein [Spirochaetales bacterium]
MTHERIRLNQILNLTVLQNFLDDVAFLTGLKATLIDRQGQLFTAPGGARDFCLLFSNNAMRNRCRDSDIHGCREAERLKKPYIYTCHAGLIDIVIPVILHDTFIGAIITGQIRLKGNDKVFKEFITLPEVKKYKNKLIAAYEKVPEKKEEEITRASSMLFRIINYIVSIEFRNLSLTERVYSGFKTKREAVERAKEYIQQNFCSNIKLTDVSHEVSISPYYLSHIFKKMTGISFIEYLTQVRIEKARELLTSTELDIINIAYTIGYNDSNYFSKVFRKKNGLTPREFRQKNEDSSVFFNK